LSRHVVSWLELYATESNLDSLQHKPDCFPIIFLEDSPEVSLIDIPEV
jgi:hypothetical protein